MINDWAMNKIPNDKSQLIVNNVQHPSGTLSVMNKIPFDRIQIPINDARW